MSSKNSHKFLSENTAGTVVSMQTSKIVTTMGGSLAGKVAGAAVSPAIWIANYMKNGSTPKLVDVGNWVAGMVSAPVGIATGTVQAVLDDDTARRLEHVRSIEPKLYREYIMPVSSYSNLAPPSITAINIASTGATAWHHPVGIWVYILDHCGSAVCDYRPINATVVYRPKMPLTELTRGIGYVVDREYY